jgi:LAO/AO transport system kinase
VLFSETGFACRASTRTDASSSVRWPPARDTAACRRPRRTSPTSSTPSGWTGSSSTVGVGQAELDVLSCADLVILVLQPGTGDVIQALKAGILEAADIFLVNKTDLPGAEILLDSLAFLFDISSREKTRPIPPVLTASAVQDQGMDELYAEMERRICGLVESGRHRENRLARLEREIRTSIQRELWDRFASLTKAEDEIHAASGKLLDGRRSPYRFIRKIFSRVRFIVQPKKARHD